MRLSLRHIPSSSASKQVVMMGSFVKEEQQIQQAMRTSRTERRKTSHKPRSKNLTTFVGVIIVMLVLQTSQSEAADVQSTNQQQQPPAARQAHFAEPESDSNIQRVAVGRSIRFKCVVNDIGDHKLAWFHKDKRVLLAFDNKTVTWKDRIQVSSQANSVFFLQIDSVQLSDKVSGMTLLLFFFCSSHALLTSAIYLVVCFVSTTNCYGCNYCLCERHGHLNEIKCFMFFCSCFVCPTQNGPHTQTQSGPVVCGWHYFILLNSFQFVMAEKHNINSRSGLNVFSLSLCFLST